MGIADAKGHSALTIRSLAHRLHVKPMALYHHVAGKNEILDGIIDEVFKEIDLPPTDVDWKAAMRARAISARRVVARPPWGIPLMGSRTNPGPNTLRHHNAVIGTRGYFLLESFIYGFVLHESDAVLFAKEAAQKMTNTR